MPRTLARSLRKLPQTPRTLELACGNFRKCPAHLREACGNFRKRPAHLSELAETSASARTPELACGNFRKRPAHLSELAETSASAPHLSGLRKLPQILAALPAEAFVTPRKLAAPRAEGFRPRPLHPAAKRFQTAKARTATHSAPRPEVEARINAYFCTTKFLPP